MNTSEPKILFSNILLRTNPDSPIVDSNNIRGGLHTVNSFQELQAISKDKLTSGMLTYVLSEDTYYKYNKTTLNWELAKLGGSGVPIYTNTLYSDLTKAPEDCIIIRDLEGESLVILNLNSINYLGTVFQAIRELQAQVAKIQNSFKYGINSFTETRTAMSTVLGELDESTEDEPLWSLEEDSLSLLEQCTVETNYMYKSNFTKLSGDDLIYDDTNSILSFPNSTYAFVDPINGFKQVPDPKSIVYISSSTLNIVITLKDESGKVINIDLSALDVSGSTFYNTMIVVSKKIRNVNTNELYGQNYMWILITDPRYNLVLKQGYYNNGELTLLLDKDLDNLYYIEQITFSKMNLYKMNSYTKALDFSYSVIPTIPLEEDYKLGVAHLTIRSISTESILDKVKDLLLDNELIWVENLKKLCIKSKGNIYNIGSISEDNNNNNTTMTIEELIASLRNLGIISINKGDSSSPEYTLKLSDVSGITFIHEDSGKRFDINIDSEGNLRSSLINNEDVIKDILTKLGLIYPDAGDENIVNWEEFLKTESGKYTKNRGFLSNVFLKDGKAAIASDSGLYSDRLKIGAVYTPYNTTTYGCSHAYIELENTSAVDINLQNFYLSVAYTNSLGTAEVLCLPLKGVIKSGSTFLIRGKLYASYDDINTNIKVKSFDLEWYVNNKLIDLEFDTIAFLLTYDKKNN